MKVYFNNSCNICKAEINLYKKENIQDLNWIDITKNKNAEEDTDKSDKELLRIWKKIPKYKFLYKFFKLPVIYHIFHVGYEIVAFFLYLKNRKQLN